MTLERALRIAAWLLLGAIVFATLSPIGLRPQVGPASYERFGAFALCGFLFALAYPKRPVLVLLLLVGSALLLEALQILTPSRHGRGFDVVVKLAGGGLGFTAGLLIDIIRRRVLGIGK